MTAGQVARLIADVGNDGEAALLDVGARRGLVIRYETCRVGIAHVEMVPGDAAIAREVEIAQRVAARLLSVDLDLAAPGDEEHFDLRAALRGRIGPLAAREVKE